MEYRWPKEAQSHVYITKEGSYFISDPSLHLKKLGGGGCREQMKPKQAKERK